MDPLKEIVKAHITAARTYHDLCELERLVGLESSSARRKAELVTTCEFYAEVKRILEELECEP